jgi:hypothetical protein
MFYFNNNCFILPYYQFDSQTGLLMFSLGECYGPTTYCLLVQYFSLHIGDNVSFKFGGVGFTFWENMCCSFSVIRFYLKKKKKKKNIMLFWRILLNFNGGCISLASLNFLNT